MIRERPETKTPTVFGAVRVFCGTSFITVFPGSLNFFERGFPLRNHEDSGFSVLVFLFQAFARNEELGFSGSLQVLDLRPFFNRNCILCSKDWMVCPLITRRKVL